MKRIKLTRGKYVIVDDDMFEFLNQWKWYAAKAKKRFYAITTLCDRDFRKTIQMHHVIIGRGLNKLITDHIDGNSLNNRRDNLRIVTYRMNSQNRKYHQEGKLVGANKRRSGNLWESHVCVNGKKIFLGNFPTEQTAHDRYVEELQKRRLK